MTFIEMYGDNIENSAESGPYVILGVWIGSLLYGVRDCVWKLAGQKEQICTKSDFKNVNIGTVSPTQANFFVLHDFA